MKCLFGLEGGCKNSSLLCYTVNTLTIVSSVVWFFRAAHSNVEKQTTLPAGKIQC